MEKIVTHSETDWGSLERLIEEIRITTLNLAITATKISGSGDARTSVRKSTSELVNLCLDTVNKLTNLLRSNASEFKSDDLASEDYLMELEKIELDIRERSERIMELLRRIDVVES